MKKYIYEYGDKNSQEELIIYAKNRDDAIHKIRDRLRELSLEQYAWNVRIKRVEYIS